MGSASFSSGVSSSSGGGGLGAGLLKVLRISAPAKGSQKTVDKDTSTICSKLANRQDFQQQFNSPLLNHVYKSVYAWNFDAFTRHDIKDILKAAGAGIGEGCIREYTQKIMEQVPETSTATKSLIRLTLDSFILRALGNDLNTYFHGNADQVVKKLDESVFKRTSNNFLGEMVNQLIKREAEGMDDKGEESLRKSSQAKADQIINSFQTGFVGKEQIAFDNLFDVIKKEPDWFKKVFKK